MHKGEKKYEQKVCALIFHFKGKKYRSVNTLAIIFYELGWTLATAATTDKQCTRLFTH